MTATPANTDEYLARLPERRATVLQELRAALLTMIPGAEEAIRTREPAVIYRGKTVVGFSAARNHLALLVMFGEALHQLAAELEPYDTGSRIVRFTADSPLPESLVRRIVEIRLSEIDEQTAPAKPASSGERLG